MALDKKLVNDLEVIDRNALIDGISDLVKVNQASARLVIVFADSASIVDDLGAELTPAQLFQAEKDFYNLVPFDETATKLIKFAKGYKAIGVNWEFYRVIVEALAPQGFRVAAVIPALAVTDLNQKEGLTDRSGATIISKLSSFKNFSFYQGVTEKEEPEVNAQPKPKSEKKSKLLPMLIGVFVLLTIILVLVVVFGS